MSKSDEIATLIPFYQQFIAERRIQAQKQADKLKRKQEKTGSIPPEAEAEPAPVPLPSETEMVPAEEGAARDDSQ